MAASIRRPRLRGALLAALVAGAVWTGAAMAAEPVYTLYVDGLACPFCAYGIEKQLRRLEGVAAIETDIEAGAVVVTMRDGAALDEATARRAVEAAGFTLRGFERETSAE